MPCPQSPHLTLEPRPLPIFTWGVCAVAAAIVAVAWLARLGVHPIFAPLVFSVFARLADHAVAMSSLEGAGSLRSISDQPRCCASSP